MYLQLNKLGLKSVKSPKDIPVARHFAILIYKTTSVHVPGDERSKQCPGHGYPEHTEIHDSFEHWVTSDDRTLKSAIDAIERANEEETIPHYRVAYAAIVVESKVTIKKSIELSFEG